MSWDELTPPAVAASTHYGNRDAAPFMIGVSRQGKGNIFKMIISGFPEKLEGQLDWWKPLTNCSVYMGRDVNAGKLMVKMGGPFLLERVGSHPKSPAGLRLTLPPHLANESRGRQPLKFELTKDGAVLLELPHWAIGAQPIRAVA